MNSNALLLRCCSVHITTQMQSKRFYLSVSSCASDTQLPIISAKERKAILMSKGPSLVPRLPLVRAVKKIWRTQGEPGNEATMNPSKP